MDREEKALAEAILRHLCLGRRICGITFYTVPILTIDVVDEPKFETNIQLTIEGQWKVFDELPVQFPNTQVPNHGVDRQRISEFICAVGQMGWHSIVDVQLGETRPHLMLIFENGQTLYINGHNEIHESWNIAAGKYLVVATPGDRVAIWCPDEFPAIS